MTEIEEARQACVDTFSAALDKMVEINKKIKSIEPVK